MKRTIASLVLLGASMAVTAAGVHSGGHGGAYSFGEPGKPHEVTRTIEIKATDDMKFLFDLPAIKQGETIRFVITNTGRLTHEFSLGDEATQRAHAKMMEKMPGMKHEDDPAAVTLAPGETKEIIWKFNKPINGKVVFACFHDNHHRAGMTARVDFEKAKQN